MAHSKLRYDIGYKKEKGRQKFSPAAQACGAASRGVRLHRPILSSPSITILHFGKQRSMYLSCV